MVAFLLLLTTVVWGATPIMEKIGLSKVDPLVGATVRSGITTCGLLLLTFLLGKGRELAEVDARSLLLFGASGVMAGILGMWSYYTALKIGATSRIVPISATYPLVTSLLSFLILGEGLTFPRLIGTLLIVCGVWLVK